MTIRAKVNYTKTDEFGNEYQVIVDEKTGELISKKPPFFGFTKKPFPKLAILAREQPLANAIFITFIDEMNEDTNAIIVSYEALMELLNKKRTSIYNAIKYLKENGFIEILKSGNMNVYCINAQFVWSKSQDKIHSAKFNATVFVTKKEQRKNFKTKF